MPTIVTHLLLLLVVALLRPPKTVVAWVTLRGPRRGPMGWTDSYQDGPLLLPTTTTTTKTSLSMSSQKEELQDLEASSPTETKDSHHSARACRTKIRVCQGSSCLGKCLGAFDPKGSLEALVEATVDDEEPAGLEIEEAFCLNQCKKGPNARILYQSSVVLGEEQVDASDEEWSVVVLPNIMTETEESRKTFQRITNPDRVNDLYRWALEVQNGEIDPEHIKLFPASKLGDILPKTTTPSKN